MCIDDVTLPAIHFDLLYSVFILQKQTFWITIPFRKTRPSIIKKSHRQPLKKISSSGNGGGGGEVGGFLYQGVH